MGLFILGGMLAAFGFFCGIWVCFGPLLSGGTGGFVVCPASAGFPEEAFMRRCLFLAQTGLIRCPILVVDRGLDPRERMELGRFEDRIEICTPEELILRIGIGAVSN